jgi:hypothetical protein
MIRLITNFKVVVSFEKQACKRRERQVEERPQDEPQIEAAFVDPLAHDGVQLVKDAVYLKSKFTDHLMAVPDYEECKLEGEVH